MLKPLGKCNNVAPPKGTPDDALNPKLGCRGVKSSVRTADENLPFPMLAQRLQSVIKKVRGIPITELYRKFSTPSPFVSSQEAFVVKAFVNRDPPDSGFRAAVIVGKKKVSKLAVQRHRASRRVKAAIQHVFPAEAPKGNNLFGLLSNYPMDVVTIKKVLITYSMSMPRVLQCRGLNSWVR